MNQLKLFLSLIIALFHYRMLPPFSWASLFFFFFEFSNLSNVNLLSSS